MERIICAAVKFGFDVHCCYRHKDFYEQFPYLAKYEPYEGFITTENGRFVGREQAWDIADEAGQIINRDEGIIGTLFSENLY